MFPAPLNNAPQIWRDQIFLCNFVSRLSVSVTFNPRFLEDLRRVSLLFNPWASLSPTMVSFPISVLSATVLSSSVLCNILFAIALLTNPILLSPLRIYSIKATKISSHSALWPGTQKSYNLVDFSVTPGESLSTFPVSWICFKYAEGKVAWYNWKDVCVIHIAKACH